MIRAVPSRTPRGGHGHGVRGLPSGHHRKAADGYNSAITQRRDGLRQPPCRSVHRDGSSTTFIFRNRMGRKDTRRSSGLTVLDASKNGRRRSNSECVHCFYLLQLLRLLLLRVGNGGRGGIMQQEGAVVTVMVVVQVILSVSLTVNQSSSTAEATFRSESRVRRVMSAKVPCCVKFPDRDATEGLICISVGLYRYWYRPYVEFSLYCCDVAVPGRFRPYLLNAFSRRFG